MSLEVIDRLIELDAEAPKRICVVGDTLVDHYAEGELLGCQDGCPLFRESSRVTTPGGAAGAARQLARWASESYLVGHWPARRFYQNPEGWDDFNAELCFDSWAAPAKTRLLHGGKVVWRHDSGERRSETGKLAEERRLALSAVREMRFDAVLISDYDKGFLDEDTIREIIRWCRKSGVLVVADGKKTPAAYEGALLKCNEEYAKRHFNEMPCGDRFNVVETRGGDQVQLWGEDLATVGRTNPVPVVNHVGAGDCFAAHLALALAHGLPLEEAAAVAHAAGRVYVQHRQGRPPHPLEIRRDIGGAGGKVLGASSAAALVLCAPRPVVFTNGTFRTGPHAGHAETLRWAKAQGATLVVGVNDNMSTFRVKRGGFYLPLEERLEMLAALGCVDWVVPFAEDTPAELCRALRPDVLVKGHDNAGTTPPGAEHAKEVRFAPPGRFAGRHASTLIKEVRGG